jgi:eukaryotic-like serine/threonine-protein kinase
VSEAENVYSRRTVGRYRLYEAFAVGGMASVHYGRMVGPLGFARTVAIKRLHREYARDPEFVAMFMDEARLAARIHHPNVVMTLDVVASEGELFLVMEYVPAVSLSQLWFAAQAKGQRAPMAVAAAIIVDVLRGLHAAHEAIDEEGNPLDIVHRDVSPQNILVGADGSARVLDFGIAKAMGRATQVTREGQVKGKFAYMAPEQMTNVGVTRQSDLFSASIVLWEALTGMRLFHAESEAALLARVLSAPIEPPSTVVPEIGRDLDGVLLRGLARDVSTRYASGREMALDLEAHTSLATASQVGEWVERLASDDLARRAVRVAEIENESRSERVSVGTVLATSPPTQETAGAQQPKAHPRPKADRYRLAALLAVAAFSAAAVGAGILSGRIAPLRAAELRVASPAPSAIGSAARPAEPGLAEKVPPAPEPPGTVSPRGPTGSSVRPQRAADVKPPPVRAAVPSTGTSTPCDPPYYADSKGHVIYKPECFR